MSFGSAFSYPFENIGKVLTLAFIYVVISLVTFLGGMLGAMVGLLLNLTFSIFVAGYMVSVTRHVADYGYGAPDNNVGDNLGRGLAVMLAGILYMLPVILVMIGGFLVLGNPFDYYSDVSTTNWVAFGLLLLLLAIFSSWSLFVGMVRFAMEDRSGALFDMGRNLNTVTNNLGICFGLFLRQFGIGLVFGIIMGVIATVWMMLVGGVGSSSIALIMALLTVYQFFIMSVSIAGQLANAHLLAGFGEALGLIQTRKPKNQPAYDSLYRDLGDLS